MTIVECNKEVVSGSQLIVLSVKPDVVKPVLQEVSSVISKDNIIVSIAAGIKLATIEKVCMSHIHRVVRHFVGCWFVSLTFGEHVFMIIHRCEVMYFAVTLLLNS